MVFGNYVVFKADEKNIAIEKTTISKEGNVTTKNKGWFSCLEAALKCLLEYKIGDSDAASVEEVMKAVQDAKDEITAVVIACAP